MQYFFTAEDTGRTAPATAVQQMGSKLITEGFYLLSTYWILVVVAAFLLVFLSGEPSVLKTVYLIFFFLFLVMYQVIHLIVVCMFVFSLVVCFL